MLECDSSLDSSREKRFVAKSGCPKWQEKERFFDFKVGVLTTGGYQGNHLNLDYSNPGPRKQSGRTLSPRPLGLGITTFSVVNIRHIGRNAVEP